MLRNNILNRKSWFKILTRLVTNDKELKQNLKKNIVDGQLRYDIRKETG